MVTSVNASSLAALLAQENAQANRSQTQTTQATGEAPDAVPGFDPAVIYAGAADAPSLSAILSAQDGLNTAASLSDMALSGGQAISDLLAQLKGTVGSAQGAAPSDRAALDAQYQQILAAIDQTAGSASFQGANLLTGGPGDLQFQSGLDPADTTSLTPLDLTSAGLGLSGTGVDGGSDDLAALLDQIDAAASSTQAQLATLGAQSNQIQTHLGVVGQLQTSLAGAGVQDLDAETAKLQALQVQQGLAASGSGIANAGPQALLALFRPD